ncbi:3-hydroxyacyl-CoA dehydrogenase family protein [Aspergillus saccharolyticus JOP 1030-1]|uniref:3-hydroxyacyl-CoA dehydrogenase n=1 Tax=Aspergillus saccharolyticus JOP 1030-1 TaxID=1450539 RepID=A0A318ZIL1_9EURO|nr:3-hydroxyacyl-CoA dehydrogenase [Aspergillus saccharolyticus JOP 1030-1]PYH47421.1 3-hydroxyacyl-CoA dehydrogenase [Aspergillus saccharolyticus JOP 1030-1]
MTRTANAVTLLGAGTQGSRLAYMWARQGTPVYIVDKESSHLSQAFDFIEELRRKESPPEKQGPITQLVVADLDRALCDSWLVIECLPENLDLKRSIIQQLDDQADPEIIIASNSSSHSIIEVCEGLDFKADDRFVNLHSFWPPETQVLEVMGTDKTRPEIIPLLMDEARKHGFQPFHVRKPSTGYIFNRIWAAIKRETLMVLEEGVATPEEVDQMYKAVLQTPKGPCEQMDVAGLDVILAIEEHYAQIRSGIPEGPRKYLREMVDRGDLGVKTGSGIFDYDK